jgi:transcriptional regulator with XRE-family HTH domain
MDEFSTRLRRLRKENDITQAQLASQIGVKPSAVGKYESGIQAYPRVEVLIKIAEFFKVSTDYLVRGVKPASSNIENVINGTLSNSPFIQANHGGVVIRENGNDVLSPEAMELLNIYSVLSGRERLKLLNYAVDLEGGKK